ncbi:zinc-dependent peptidase [Marinobacterium sp. YM272]|uniref:M90 family metallopeptidase n=1 Tax=Marinobacterium sp. YM272 TaxID=3421654 RepID=UPI003D7F7DB9
MFDRIFAILSGHEEPVDAIDDELWLATLQSVPLLRALTADKQSRLRRLSERFIQEKQFFGGDGLEPDSSMGARIATLACLPVLELGMEWLAPIREIVIYPAPFLVRHDAPDEFGIVHEGYEALSGEAWDHGTLVLAWPDVLESGWMDRGHNVVIHEIAHVLDNRNGSFNGFPPLHRGMDNSEWTREFSAAFDTLNRQLDKGEDTLIDPYAATAPTEFFAVTSEYHFERPDILAQAFPQVARLMDEFYSGAGN